MRMNFGEVLTIEDLGSHSVATVIGLGILLAGTVNATPEPKRKDSYEVEDGDTVYYIHVSPVTGTIFLLATWGKLAASGGPLIRCDSYLHPGREVRPESRSAGT
jgi:hypothetical protein